ncbi:MAG: hypothetical protein GXP17_05075 [Gammaproteobacteria bacterium]|nr:hypothetical protein [Gammaproteobacteria bacterium]
MFLIFFFLGNVQAEQIYTPSNVFSELEYANRTIDKILDLKGVNNIKLPKSKEKAVKPMHVYELHVSVLGELYYYAIKNNRRPPPLTVSTPIKYTPTDVYYLTRLVVSNIEEIYRDSGGVTDFSVKKYIDKTPVDVYQKLFELYYKLNRLNGKKIVSPSEVYAHIYRAKEDLQYSLLTLSKRLNDVEEEKKRLLITAIYGMHPDGTVLPPLEKGKTPEDVIEKAFDVRDKLNELRKRSGLPEIKRPKLDEYKTVKPIDVFLQTQFIIAELNLLKIPMNIHSTTNSAKPTAGKIPSDVYHEMKHIDYMLDRLIHSL